eukprot:TRINITY_DN719_c0_g1_i4.p1 TRINITY_DN719_c0_g1~~TRINITY_DN719_c0_g1_i4.p1  ORF type:complete len:1277 (-),score=435.67 TRINITY_DN719_c0_g1_i4:179-4009(-)
MRSNLFPLFLSAFLLVSQAFADCPSTSGVPTWSSTYSNAPDQDIVVNGKVVLDSSPSVVYKSITISGTLIVKNVNLELKTEWIKIVDGGSLLVGGSDCPITNKVIFTFYGDASLGKTNVIGTELEEIGVTTAYGYKGLVLTTGGSISMWGYAEGPSWTRVASTVPSGSNTITLKEAVKWRANDVIIVTSTDFGEVLDRAKWNGTVYPTTGAAGTPDQTERRTIKSVSADGLTITLTVPLNYTHWGKDHQFAEVGLLSKRIVIQSNPEADLDGFGGHFMMRKGKRVELSGIEVTRMGQRGVLARYPVHFHNMRFVDDIKPFIKDSSIHDNFQRCLVVHESHGVTIKNNVAYNTTGHCYFLEDGGEHMNVFENNLGAYVRPIGPFGSSDALLPTDNRATVFWITNPANTFTNNVAVGGFHGFWFAMPEKPRNLGAKYWALNDTMQPRRLPLVLFDGNIAHSNRANGMHIDEMEDEDGNTEQSTFSPPRDKATFYRFTAYKNRGDGIWGKSSLEFVENVLQDNSRAFMTNGRTVLRDSIITGETDNIGNPYLVYNPKNQNSRTFPDRNGGNSTFLQGHSSYDNGGPQFSVRNHFSGFKSTPQRRAAALVPLFNGPFMLYPKNHFGHELTFDDDTNRIWINYGGADVSYGWNVLDADGSVTGIKGGAWIQSNETHFNRPGCEWRANWNAFVCPLFGEGYVQFTLSAPNGIPGASSSQSEGYEIVKTGSRTIRAVVRPLGADFFTGVKGQMQGATPSGGNFQYMHNVIARKSYSFDFYTNTGDASYTPNPLILNMAGSHSGDWIIVALPYPLGTTFKVNRGSTNYTLANSFESLNLTNYFYDSQTKHFYVIFQNTGNGQRPEDVFGFKIPSLFTPSITVEASCGALCQPSLEGVPPKFAVPKALQADTYAADLDPCQVPKTGSDLGKAFFFLHPKSFGGKTELHFKIFHDLAGNGNKISIGSGDARKEGDDIISQPIPIGNTASSGILYLSRDQYEKLASGKLFVRVRDSNGNQVLRGQILCSSTSCTKPPKSAASLYDVCKPPYSTVSLYSDGNFTANATRYAFNSNHTLDLAYTGSVLCGSYSMKIGVIGNMGVGMQWNKPDIGSLDSKWKSIEFFLKLDRAITNSFSFVLSARTSNNEGGYVTVNNDLETDNFVIANDVWTRVRVSLARLSINSATTGKLKSVYVQYSSATYSTDIIIDEWRLTDQEVAPITELSDVQIPPYGPVCVNDTNDVATNGSDGENGTNGGNGRTLVNLAGDASTLSSSLWLLLVAILYFSA